MGMECGPAGFELYPLMGRANKNENGNGVWARQDSNLRPSDYESPALTAAPRARYKSVKCPSAQCHAT